MTSPLRPPLVGGDVRSGEGLRPGRPTMVPRRAPAQGLGRVDRAKTGLGVRTTARAGEEFTASVWRRALWRRPQQRLETLDEMVLADQV